MVRVEVRNVVESESESLLVSRVVCGVVQCGDGWLCAEPAAAVCLSFCVRELI